MAVALRLAGRRVRWVSPIGFAWCIYLHRSTRCIVLVAVSDKLQDNREIKTRTIPYGLPAFGYLGRRWSLGVVLARFADWTEHRECRLTDGGA